MSFENLDKKIPAPKSPNENTGDWSEVEKKMRLIYPDDYKKIISTYGSGGFFNFFYCLNPFSTQNNYDYYEHVREILDAARAVKEIGCIEFEVFNSKDGIFPLIVTDNGDILYCMVANGKATSDNILYDARHGFKENYKGSVSTFLLSIFDNSFSSIIFEKPESLYFEPY